LTTSDLFIARDTILKLKDAIDTGEPIKSMINGGVILYRRRKRKTGNQVKTDENLDVNYLPGGVKNDRGDETNEHGGATLNHWGFISGKKHQVKTF
jgi:ribosome-associated protein YbcJ (S4-like RNA binding protein)